MGRAASNSSPYQNALEAEMKKIKKIKVPQNVLDILNERRERLYEMYNAILYSIMPYDSSKSLSKNLEELISSKKAVSGPDNEIARRVLELAQDHEKLVFTHVIYDNIVEVQEMVRDYELTNIKHGKDGSITLIFEGMSDTIPNDRVKKGDLGNLFNIERAKNADDN